MFAAEKINRLLLLVPGDNRRIAVDCELIGITKIAGRHLLRDPIVANSNGLN
jgi:hypothetical protein